MKLNQYQKGAASERKALNLLIKGHLYGSSMDTGLAYLMLLEKIHADKDIKTIYKLIFLNFEEYAGSITNGKVIWT